MHGDRLQDTAEIQRRFVASYLCIFYVIFEHILSDTLIDTKHSKYKASIEAIRQRERFDERGYVIREETGGKMVGFISAEVVEDGFVHIGPLAVAPSNQVDNRC